MKTKAFLISISLLVFVLNSFSQNREFEFKNLTQENGLPSNESYFVYRDSRDFLWFATDQGVVRFNGSKMEHFDLPDNVIFKIREDSKGRIWFFSRTGKLAYFFNGSIYPYRYNDRIVKDIVNILITDAWVNDNNEVIINSGSLDNWENYKISNSGSIERSRYRVLNDQDPTTFRITQINDKQFFTQRTALNLFRFDTIYIQLVAKGHTTSYRIPWIEGIGSQYGCVTADGKDLFFFSGNGMVKLNGDGSFKTKYFNVEIASLAANENIWVGFMKQGTALLDTDLNEVYKEPALKDKSITSIRTDHEGGIWFSTLEKGIFYLKNSHINHFFGDSSLAGPVFRICNSGDGNILYANTTGIYKPGNNFISTKVLQHNSTKINDLFIDGQRNIYLSGTTDQGGCFWGCMYKKSSNSSYNSVFILTSFSEMIPLPEYKYLLSTYGHLLEYTLGSKIMNTESSNCIMYDSINSSLLKPGVLFRDSKQQVWMGTINALYKFNSISSSPVEFEIQDSLFKKGITCIRQMENGVYSIGVRFAGIALMKDSSIIGRISENEGILSNSIRYLLPLKDQLWAVTAKGISVISFRSYNPLKYTVTNIGKNAGLYNSIIYQLMPYQGNMLAATSNGIYEINDPEQFLNAAPKPIPFYINSISYYKGDTSQVNSINLPYNYNRVTVKYSAVCFNLPEEVKYYYRFDNTDPDWHEIAATELLMENLIPGTYNLEIKAVIPGEQRFSEVQKLQITVEKAWWQNNWLKIAGLIFFTGVVFIIYKKRVNTITRREQKNTALRAKMMELEQTALRSQMNPHFIFNCLSSIQQLVVTGNKNEANEYLVRFARLIRKTLELSGRSFISIEEETGYLNEYLLLEQLRIPGQFEFTITIDPKINKQKTEIRNMILQPIVENSIRHGIKHLDNKKGHILVLLEQKENYIFCSITDNGIGRKTGKDLKDPLSENKSYGMDIVNKRLEGDFIHHEKETILEVEDLYNKDGSTAGTKVTLRLPFRTK